jgi:PiT family inorganic phosphate transporter
MFSHIFNYLGGLFLGWGLGANDSANVFGMAVGSKMVSWKKAAILTSVFVLIGAVLQGRAGIETLAHSLAKERTKDHHYMKKIHQKFLKDDDKTPGKFEKIYKEFYVNRRTGEEIEVKGSETSKFAGTAIADPDHPKFTSHQFSNAMIMSFSAALTVAIMTILRLPVSTSQAVVGSIIGVGLIKGDVEWSGLIKVVACWIGTPVGGAVFTLIFFYLFRYILNKWNPSAVIYDRTITILLILTGCCGAYALGANNVANVSAVFVMSGAMTVSQAEWFGGIAIAIGVITYSKPVMETVGGDIVRLDAFMAFITVLSLSVTVWIYALIGVPVSTTQAVVGAVLGFGVIKGAHTVNFKTLGKISTGWFFTPICGGVFAAAFYFISNLHYIPS